jgi:hypothetical protein
MLGVLAQRLGTTPATCRKCYIHAGGAAGLLAKTGGPRMAGKQQSALVDKLLRKQRRTAQ